MSSHTGHGVMRYKHCYLDQACKPKKTLVFYPKCSCH